MFVMWLKSGDVFDDLLEKVSAFNDGREAESQSARTPAITSLRKKQNLVAHRLTIPSNKSNSTMLNASMPMRPQTARLNMSFQPKGIMKN